LRCATATALIQVELSVPYRPKAGTGLQCNLYFGTMWPF